MSKAHKHPRLVLPALILLETIALTSCDELPCYDCGVVPHVRYALQTAPESVLVNLVTSYRFREINEYARLLAPEFTFQFQPDDVVELGLDDAFWTRGEDSIATRCLFTTNEISHISFRVDPGPVEDSDMPSHPAGAKKIRILQTELEVAQTDGVIWVVSNPQDLYFRRGNGTSAVEDTTLWLLLEWDDLDLFSGSGLAPASLGASLGKLKATCTSAP